MSFGLGRLLLLGNELRRHYAEVFAGEEWMQVAGFRPPCVGVLRVVAAEGPLSQREISDRLGLDPSDLVGAIDVLEEAGFVERNRDPEDRRRHAVVATSEGHEAAERLGVLADKAEAQALANLSAPEREQLLELITKALGERAPAR